MTEFCLACGEGMWPGEDGVPRNTLEGLRFSHRECALREVLGGIGHHIAHEYWCGAPRHDPDAGLTKRQSAVLVAKLYEMLADDIFTRHPPPTVGRDLSGVEAEQALDDEDWWHAEPQWGIDGPER